MSDSVDFRREARRLLFDEPEQVQQIPGAGKPATEDAARHSRIKVTINLDGDVVQHFKHRARDEGRAYQSLINQVLREHIDGTRPERLAEEVKQVVLGDVEFLKRLSREVEKRLKD